MIRATTNQNLAALSYEDLVFAGILSGFGGLMLGLVWFCSWEIARKTGEAPPWEELMPWLRFIPHRRRG